MIVIIFIIFLKLYRLFSLKPFKHKIYFPLKPEIYFPYRVSILVHFRFFTFQEVNLLSSGNRVSVSVEPWRLTSVGNEDRENGRKPVFNYILSGFGPLSLQTTRAVFAASVW